MSTIGTRLKESREKKGLLQAELAKMIGVKSAGVISNWEQDVSKPKADKMIEICQVLGISLSYLLDYYGEEKAPPYSEEALKLAGDYDKQMDDRGRETVRGVADLEVARFKTKTAALRESREQMEAGEMLEVETLCFMVPWFFQPMGAGPGEMAGSEPPEDLRLTKAPPRGTSFVTRVHGVSMEPTYHDGDLVFVHSAEEIQVGRIGAFFMDGQQWIKELGDEELISHNPGYNPIPMREDIRCQGLVLGVCDESYFE